GRRTGGDRAASAQRGGAGPGGNWSTESFWLATLCAGGTRISSLVAGRLQSTGGSSGNRGRNTHENTRPGFRSWSDHGGRGRGGAAERRRGEIGVGFVSKDRDVTITSRRPSKSKRGTGKVYRA